MLQMPRVYETSEARVDTGIHISLAANVEGTQFE